MMTGRKIHLSIYIFHKLKFKLLTLQSVMVEVSSIYTYTNSVIQALNDLVIFSIFFISTNNKQEFVTLPPIIKNAAHHHRHILANLRDLYIYI